MQRTDDCSVQTGCPLVRSSHAESLYERQTEQKSVVEAPQENGRLSEL